jgi:hypothetical protein
MPRADFKKTLLLQNPPKIVLRPHIIDLLQMLRSALEKKSFALCQSFELYGEDFHAMAAEISLFFYFFLTISFVFHLLVLCCGFVSCSGGIMGGGKTTTLLIAEYFADQANALVIAISGSNATAPHHIIA